MNLLATVPTEVTALMTDCDTVWGLAKDFILAVLVFTVLIKIAKKVRRA